MPPPDKRVTFEPSLIFVETPSSLPILDSPSDQGLRHDGIVLKSHVKYHKNVGCIPFEREKSADSCVRN